MPLPRIDDLLRKHGGYAYFTKLDISMQYYTFVLDEFSITGEPRTDLRKTNYDGAQMCDTPANHGVAGVLLLPGGDGGG